jgi:hypothetical protein
MKEIKTDAEGYPVWSERFAWKVFGFWWEFVEAIEDCGKAAWELLENPFMILFVVLGLGAFVISAMGTWWWGW